MKLANRVARGCIAVLSALAWSCSGNNVPAGSEGGVCRNGDSCNDGLTCLSHRCVRLLDDVRDDAPFEAFSDAEVGDLDSGVVDSERDEVRTDTGDESSADARLDTCEDECVAPVDPCPNGFCHVPAGPFWMGSNWDGSQCPTNHQDEWQNDWELPCHLVDVAEFWIGRTEVTVAQYKAYVEAQGTDCTGCLPLDAQDSNWYEAGHDQYPVNHVTWFQADSYCKSSGGRLCTEAEWEKAARGTDGRLYPWGNEAPNCDRAVFTDVDVGCVNHLSAPVASKPLGASPYGVLDMAGNIEEFVQDWIHVSYQGAPSDGSAWEVDPADNARVVRGGYYWAPASTLRAAGRGKGKPSQADMGIGIRCCRDTPPEEP